jgi:hypothetical protein
MDQRLEMLTAVLTWRGWVRLQILAKALMTLITDLAALQWREALTQQLL